MFLKALKSLVNIQSMPLAFYISVGFLISQFSNIFSYYSRGGTKLMTWFKLVGLTNREPSIFLISQLCIIMAILTFIGFQMFASYACKWPSLSILTRSIIFFVILCILSQLLFSSVMRFSYEILFCFVVIVSMVLVHTFFQTPIEGLTTYSPEYNELWDHLKYITTICLGIPILMGGAGFITSFYQTEQDMIRLQLYRHIAMAVYFELGAILFLIYPVLKRVLLIRGS